MDKFVVNFTDEQLRVATNLEQHYETWIDIERAMDCMPYGMKWKTVSGHDYLYQVHNREGNGKSLGARSKENEILYDNYHATKNDLKLRLQGAKEKLIEDGRLYRAMRLPTISSSASAILRESDRRGLLGSMLMVIGTNAMPAYALEAGGTIGDAPIATDDFDMAVVAVVTQGDNRPIWEMLHAVDATYTTNTEKSFQARNRDAYEVEFLVAPSRMSGVQRRDQPKPVPLPEQEWLLNGQQVRHVVVSSDGAPALIVAPDPRWYALQKLWMSEQDKRNPLKRPKDRHQGVSLLNAVSVAMPHYPMDAEFEAGLPPELAPYFAKWKENKPEPPAPRW